MMHRDPRYRAWAAALFCLAFCTLAGCMTTVPASPDTRGPVGDEFTSWRLTLNGTTERVLTMEDLQAMPAVTGHGYAVSTVGIRYGPWVCRGVDLRDLAALVGGVGPNDQVWISAPDGYLWVFDHEQLEGRGFVTFNPDLKEIPSPPLRVILVYELDGHPLSYDDGGPSRVGIVSDIPGVVTEGSAWVKWVDRIEVRRT
jgi:DMSO/TMAO reductase YedYZ molybdopterin-dependent catalytic subunit